MSESAARTIGLVVEAEADARTAQILVDRVMRASRGWIDDSHLPHLRSWRGIDPNAPFTAWKTIRALCRAHGVVAHGRFGGEPGTHDARAARRALLLFARLGVPDAIILLRDADNHPERREGFEQARAHLRDPSIDRDRVAIGVAEPEREAWHIAGFEPKSPDERAALDRERTRLGYDPTAQPHRLHGEGKHAAKPVLAALTKGDHERATDCLRATELAVLRSSGQDCGLAAFLDELEARVVSAIV